MTLINVDCSMSIKVSFLNFYQSVVRGVSDVKQEYNDQKEKCQGRTDRMN